MRCSIKEVELIKFFLFKSLGYIFKSVFQKINEIKLFCSYEFCYVILLFSLKFFLM